MALKIHPSVDALIKPIVYEITKIHIAQKTNPSIGSHNEPEAVKLKKRDCVHVLFDGQEYRIGANKTADGRLVCDGCGREIATKFDKSGVDTITNTIAVINQLTLFGLLNGLKAEPLAALIQLKKLLPEAAQLLSELNEYVKRDNSTSNAEKNIGTEYNTPNSFRGITSM